MSTSLDNKVLQKSVDILSRYLADSYFLYFKTHVFHWNVKGQNFYSLHKLFEEQYNTLFESLDTIAERIRFLECEAPSSFTKMQMLSSLKEASETQDAQNMLSILTKDHEIVIANLRKWIVDTANDAATQDYLTGNLSKHEKMAWMLRAHFA